MTDLLRLVVTVLKQEAGCFGKKGKDAFDPQGGVSVEALLGGSYVSGDEPQSFEEMAILIRAGSQGLTRES